MTISARAKAMTALVQIGVKPVLSAYSHSCHLPVPWPYDLISRTVELCSSVPKQVQVSRVRRDVSGESWFTVTSPKGYTDAETAILYIHGGALLVCSPKTHKRFIGHLSRVSQSPVYSPNYPMIHKAPLSDIVDGLVDFYTKLTKQHRHVIIAGDSAGGYLTLKVAAAVAAEGRVRQPDGLLLVSPLSNLDTRETLAGFAGRSDPAFPRDALKSMAVIAKKNKTATSEFAIDWESLRNSNLPPVYLNFAGNEMLSIDGMKIARELDVSEVHVHRDIALHVYPVLCELLPESMREISSMGRWIRQVFMKAEVRESRRRNAIAATASQSIIPA